MNLSNKIKLLLGTSLCLSAAMAVHAQESTATPVEFVSQIQVEYPESQRNTGNEGWVRANFIVDKQGKAKNILFQDSYGGAEFEEAAKLAILRAEFKPATYKGKVVEQNIDDLVINIASDQTELAVDQEFANQYQLAIDAMKANKYSDAETIIKNLSDSGGISLEEIARLEVLRSQFAAKRGDRLAQLKHLRNAKIGNGVFLPESMLIDVIRMHSAVALQNSLFFEAYDSYTLLERIAPTNELVSKLALIQAPIKKAIQEGRPIRVRGILDARGQWIYRPIRTNFAFTQMSEGIKTLEPRCEHSNQKFTAQTEQEWRIPDSWGLCTLVIYGEPGAQFELMEYPDAPDVEK